MNDVPHETYERQERIAIRVAGGMTEAAATALTDAENQSQSMLKRIAALSAHQRAHAKPVPLTMPVHEPFLTAKDLAAGEVA